MSEAIRTFPWEHGVWINHSSWQKHQRETAQRTCPAVYADTNGDQGCLLIEKAVITGLAASRCFQLEAHSRRNRDTIWRLETQIRRNEMWAVAPSA